MFLADFLGATLTLVALVFLALGGYLAALSLLGPRVAADPLSLSVASLLLATAEATAIGLFLGGLGVLRIDLALLMQGLLILLLLGSLSRRPGGLAGLAGGGLGAPALLLARRVWAVMSHHWAPSILALHAIGSEALRGLLRPPLSWDALMYHLLLAGTWLRDQNLAPVLGNIPVNYYGYVPANGSVWFWWWMAPSHSELYVNLASLPHLVLVALAAGAIARDLGATRHWPLAAYLVALTPTVVRFAATEYVDLFLAGTLLAGLFFGLRWLRSPGWAEALLFGAGLGLASGAKVLGVAYGLAAGGAAVLLARGSWGRRAGQLVAIVAVVVLLGGYFYLRNMALGADPLATVCERTSSGPRFGHEVSFPRPSSPVMIWGEMTANARLLDAFLGAIRPQSLELGLGPQVFLLLPALAFPLLLARERRREGWMVALLLWAALLFWFTVPFARSRHVYANIRYLIPCLALAFGGLLVLAERRAVRERWLVGLVVALLAQGLLQLHAEMPFGVRMAIGLADVAVAVMIFWPAARALVVRRRRELSLAALAACLLAAPWLARFRVADRDRALATEFTAHQTVARLFAPGWAWLDRNAGDGAVAVVHAPNNYLTYPTMGPRLERDVRYVNFNEADLRYAFRYPLCQPRVDPSPVAWVRNLVKRRIRWIHLARFPGFDFPIEGRWAEAMPRLFALRYAEANNRIYELTLPESPAPSPAR